LHANRLLRDYTWHLLYQLVNILAPILTIPYLARIFSPKELGLVASTASLFQFAAIPAALGVGIYGMRAIALDGDDRARATQHFAEIATNVLAFSAAFFGLCLAGVLVGIRDPTRRSIALVSCLNLVVCGTDVSWFFVGQARFAGLARRALATKLVLLGLLLAFIRTPEDLTIYAGLLVIASLLGNLSLLPALRNALDKSVLARHVWRPNLKHATLAIPFLVPLVFSQVYATLDRFTLEQFSSAVEVGLYDQGQKLVRTMAVMLLSIPAVLAPRIIGRLQEKRQEAVLLFRQAVSLMQSGAVLLGCLLFLNALPITHWVFGAKFSALGPVLRVLAWFPVAHMIGQSFGPMMLFPLGRNSTVIRSTFGAMLISLIGTATLAPAHGATGGASVLLAAELVNGTLQALGVRDYVPIGKVVSDTGKSLIVGALALAVSLYLRSITTFQGLSELLLINSALVTTFVGGSILAGPLGVRMVIAHLRGARPASNVW
jgi:O-antigen/teichoic acid export membrane protein